MCSLMVSVFISDKACSGQTGQRAVEELFPSPVSDTHCVFFVLAHLVDLGDRIGNW